MRHFHIAARQPRNYPAVPCDGRKEMMPEYTQPERERSVRMSDQIEPGAMKQGLQKWADRNFIRPADFARKMGYSYNHAYQLLRGEENVTADMLGRIVITYGPDAAAEILKLANEQA
jgi:plasmid maintenance system antidote protein VapI